MHIYLYNIRHLGTLIAIHFEGKESKYSLYYCYILRISLHILCQSKKKKEKIRIKLNGWYQDDISNQLGFK